MQNSATDIFSTFKRLSKPDDKSYRPLVFDATKVASLAELDMLLKDLNYAVSYHDTLASQVKELFKIRNPDQRLSENELDGRFKDWKASHDPLHYGCYVYYPWQQRLVHLVGEEEFVELRTARNKYKITQKEQDILAQKKVGVIGLSVGQSVSVTMAMERVFGSIRLADFDELELSNMNRIRTGLPNLGLPKTLIVAREIAEIDPFLQVELFSEGITEDNIDAFLGEGDGALDVLVEECDSLDVKIMARQKARAKRIPVLMDTSDRGMLDIERFDLEPDRPLLHGRVGDKSYEDLKALTYEEKVPFILDMVGADQMSPRLKASMLEVKQSLSSWPQLGGEVTLGGALTTTFLRELLLERNPVASGRHYFDPLSENQSNESEDDNKKDSSEEESLKDLDHLKTERNSFAGIKGDSLSEEEKGKIIEAAHWAPSAGNIQPWKFSFRDDLLYIFYDPHKSNFYGDYERTLSALSIGFMLENIKQIAHDNNLELKKVEAPDSSQYLCKVIAFYRDQSKNQDAGKSSLKDFVFSRHTNRSIVEPQPLPYEFREEFEQLTAGLYKKGIKFTLITASSVINSLAQLVSEADIQRLMSQEGHRGFFNEVRWGDESARITGDGIDIETVDVAPSELAGFTLARDWRAIEFLGKEQLGSAFGELTKKQMKASSAILHVAAKDFSREAFIKGGEVIQKVWLLAEKHGVGFHPLLSSCIFNNIYRNGGADMLHAGMKNTLRRNESAYFNLLGLNEEYSAELFLTRLFSPAPKVKRSYRRNLNRVLF